MRKRTYRSSYRRPRTAFRRYRRKINRRRFVRRVANVASKKKRTTLNITTNTLSPNTLSAIAEGTTNSDGVTMILPDDYARQGRKMYMCNVSAIPFSAGSLEPEISREDKKSIFFKGIRTDFRYTTEGSHPWTHRRIVVQTPSSTPRMLTVPTTAAAARDSRYNQLWTFAASELKYPYYAQNWVTAAESGGNTVFTYHDVGGAATNLLNLVFKGAGPADASGSFGDFFTLINAPLDNKYVRVLSDTKFKIDANDDNGKDLYRKLWVPVNKTIQYDAEEAHQDFNTSLYSSTLYGGDIYILDFYATTFGNAAERLRVAPLTTLYWHESLQ